MHIKLAAIHPSQDFLKPGTINYILTCIQADTLEKLPPAPIVKALGGGQYVAIDGHNLLAVYQHLKVDEVEVHVATSADDGLAESGKDNRARNAELKAKYDSVQAVGSFADLTAQYAELF